MDQDLQSIIGGSPSASVMERLYALALQDSRTNAANLEQFRDEIATFREWFKSQYTALPPEIFDEDDRLYERCVRDGLELRKQQLSTATTKATEDDIINDGFRIGHEIFRRIQSRKAQVRAGTLDPKAVPTQL